MLFFAGGFGFDAAVLKRIDEPSTLIQQGAYLVVIGLLLSLVQYYEVKKLEPPRLLQRAWRFIDHLIHFFMGTLLNAYSIFYFHSASGLTAVGLLVVVGCLLAINEMPRFHHAGAVVLYALYSICLTSYFAYLVPVLLGHLNRWMFYGAVVLALVPLSLQVAALWRWTADRGLVLRQAVAPALLVQLIFVLGYAFRLAPPVPLAVKEIGIYHNVTREHGGPFHLFRERAAWRFWEKGDQTFLERPGDKVFVFARIFAPSHFSDPIDVAWFHHGPSGWSLYSNTRLSAISGKSGDRGFGTDALITHPPAGEWRVELQTDDGYTVGQLHFDIEEDTSAAPRDLHELVDSSSAPPTPG